MKTIKILPSINNIDFCGRVYTEPTVSQSGNVMRFELIRNLGGNHPPVIMSFVMYKPDNGKFPEFIKKGAPVVAHAYVTANTWVDKDGNPQEAVMKVIKKVEPAELVEKKIKDGEPEPADAEDDGSAPEIKEL